MRRKIFISSTGILLMSCAFNVAHVSYHPTDLLPQPQSGKFLTIKKAMKINGMPCGYSRTLQEGSNWDLIGSIPDPIKKHIA